jgi:hypothetical protein
MSITYKNVDFNLSHYTIKDMKEMFELTETNYDVSTIDNKHQIISQKIINDQKIPNEVKTKIIQFISEIKKTLCDDTTKNSKFIDTLKNTYKNIYNTNLELKPSPLDAQGDHYIIDRNPTPYGQSSPSEFYQGVINPLKKRIIRTNLNIDTKFRENYYQTKSSNFSVNLPLILNNIVSMQLSALEFPGTFYTISKIFQNNFFMICIPHLDPLLVEIPDGNYDYLSLQNYINLYLSSQTTLYNKITFVADINVPNGTGVGGTGKMVVKNTDPNEPFDFTLDFEVDMNNNQDNTALPLKFGWLIGFRNGIYKGKNLYASEGIIDLAGPKYIYLVVNDFNNSVNDSFYGAFCSSILNKDILARISLPGNIFSYFSENNFNLVTNPRQYFGPVTITKLQIQLLDENGRILNLNNMDYSFCLTFQKIYDL